MLAHGFRFFRRDASVAVPAAAILAVGLGANIAIFAVAYAVLLRPLPVADQGSLVIMWERAEQQSVSVWEVSYRDFRDWESQNASFTQLAATGSINWSLRLMQKAGPVILPFTAVSGSFFDLLGTRPALGRTLTRADDQRAAPGVAVLSDATWRNQFGADPGVIGRAATIDDGAGTRSVTVVGVMPPEFEYPRGAAVWLPIAPTLARLSADAGFDMLQERGLGILYVLGRLKPGVDLARARADLNTIVGRLTATGAPGSRGRSIVMTPLVDHIFGQTRPALLLLIGAAALVLFLTCANVIGLLLARLSANRRELAIQVALGAGRSHLGRQAAAEGGAVAIVGLAAAIPLAFWGMPLVTSLAPDTVPRLGDVTLRLPEVTAFTVAAAALAALACAALPLAILMRRTTPNLTASDDTTGRTATLRVRNGLLVVQTALAVVLLVGATLTVRSFQAIQRVHLGFDPAGLVTFDVIVPDGKYKRDVNRRFYRQVLERVRQLPGVSEAAAVYLRPFEFGPIGSGVAVVIEGQSPRDRLAWRKNPALNNEAVTPEYFTVMRIPVLQGRAFGDRDTEHTDPVVIVSASAARRLWPGQNPIGKRLMTNYDQPKEQWQTVVGVVGDVRYRGLTEPSLDLYKPHLQSQDAVKHFIVNASEVTSSTLGQLRAEIRSLDPDAVVDAIRPMQVIVDRQFAPWRFAALLFSLLAALALVVAVAGVYALLAYHVAERTREIGIRMALGARRNQIVRFMVLRTSVAIGAGLLAGVAVALVGGRSLNALLFGVTPADPLSYAIVSVLLLSAAMVGAWRPIRHATAVDPVVALREE